MPTFVTLGTHPAFHAGFVAILITGIMSKEVISGPTELIAAKAIVVVITGHSDLILEVGNPRVLFQCLPLPAGVYHARVRSLFNYAIRFWGGEGVKKKNSLTFTLSSSDLTILATFKQVQKSNYYRKKKKNKSCTLFFV